ncbi:M48 family metallopeptidase [Leptolyngbya iicbica]|uniref:Peptidase M48 Ste24p n=2 Tax=Cyanophyceae TaxID=3028117 RepID=A0A4Q7EG15_9CYAN|nr:M48 family metallopeptidase [Leptolyngbya sp. LK]RZM82027.1 peptidase M48 Ste24p [Leptolyngbya sp. LK]
MNKGRRLIAWCLVGLLISTGWQWFAWGGQPGYASSPPVLAQTPAEEAPSPTALEELSIPEANTSTDDDPAPTTETLDLPDFEPQLPVESSPEEAPSNDDEWTDTDIESTGTDTSPPKITKRQQILMTADEHYLAGDYATAEVLYRQVKDAVWRIDPASLRPEPITDPADLPPAGAVYWREAQAGYEMGLTHRTLVPLELLVEEYPEFIPAQAFYSQYLIENDRAAEADAILDQSLMLYPSQPELLQARTQAQMALEQWIEAAITAKQFALLNPEHPDRDEMDALSAQNLDRFRAEMNEELTGNLIGNLITGTAGLLLTGGLIGPFTALNSAMILLQGESAVGASVAEQAKDQLPMLRDRQIEEYLNRIGQELASLAGRDEFTYEFYVVDEPELNAFALPGGKIFINAGAILKTESEAELAGLVAHELAHAVLSHGFQLVTNGNLLSSIAGVIPIREVGGLAANLIFSSYSREMERQADILGTQLLSAAGYAADGLHSLMITLEDEVGDRGGVQWFSSHPAPEERVDYLQQIVEVGGFNRYAYEGVAPHLTIQQRVARLATKEPEPEPTMETVE